MAGRKETVSDREILEVLYQSGEHILTTSEIADAIDFSLEGARKRLYRLDEDGLIEHKKVGNSPAWWITADGQRAVEEDQ